ncbi:MAG: TusE/DsrC/DsvC family sulfur relay protein [Gammaproteobacteria bacterium]|nr:TusE/DsrC/DsvC family sulfur relay protein [Gammaproteobacteria bacterium]MCK5263881.1 TusE/DsrC/DsvC family sulfur relay protein [Gammaproteobacteria bacterium]
MTASTGDDSTRTASPQRFPYAPYDWIPSDAEFIARENNLTLEDDHWELMRCLQEYYSRTDFPKLRAVTDALDENFHSKGGMKYLHQLIPNGPISQGCKLAGLKVPAGSVDPSFGSTA